MPPFWVGFSKQRKTGVTKVVEFVQNAFFQLSPSGRSEKTALGSNFTILVSCHQNAGVTKVVEFRGLFYNFGFMPPFWGKRKKRVHESGPIAFKTRFVKFPHRGETKKHPWDRILQFRFHATILGGLFQAAQNAGVTKVVEFR